MNKLPRPPALVRKQGDWISVSTENKITETMWTSSSGPRAGRVSAGAASDPGTTCAPASPGPLVSEGHRGQGCHREMPQQASPSGDACGEWVGQTCRCRKWVQREQQGTGGTGDQQQEGLKSRRELRVLLAARDGRTPGLWVMWAPVGEMHPGLGTWTRERADVMPGHPPPGSARSCQGVRCIADALVVGTREAHP